MSFFQHSYDRIEEGDTESYLSRKIRRVELALSFAEQFRSRLQEFDESEGLSADKVKELYESLASERYGSPLVKAVIADVNGERSSFIERVGDVVEELSSFHDTLVCSVEGYLESRDTSALESVEDAYDAMLSSLGLSDTPRVLDEKGSGRDRYWKGA